MTTQDNTPRSENVAKMIKLRQEHPDLSLQQIGDLTGVNRATVYRALKRYNINTRRTNDFIRQRAVILADIQDRLLESIDTESINKSSLRDRVTAAAILYDKERLETGKSTQNVALSKIVEEIDRKHKAAK